jgi:hypothetical protein
MKTIPKYLRAYLENLSPAQKDEVWVWADGAAAIDEVTEIVGNEDGLLNRIIRNRIGGIQPLWSRMVL